MQIRLPNQLLSRPMWCMNSSRSVGAKRACASPIFFVGRSVAKIQIGSADESQAAAHGFQILQWCHAHSFPWVKFKGWNSHTHMCLIWIPIYRNLFLPNSAKPTWGPRLIHHQREPEGRWQRQAGRPSCGYVAILPFIYWASVSEWLANTASLTFRLDLGQKKKKKKEEEGRKETSFKAEQIPHSDTEGSYLHDQLKSCTQDRFWMWLWLIKFTALKSCLLLLLALFV